MVKKEIIKSVASLTAIAVVCAVILVVANLFLKTEPQTGLDEKLIAKLEGMLGEGTYAELDTGAFTFADKDTKAVYRKTEGDKKDTVIYYIYSNTGFNGCYVGLLVAIDADKVVAVDVYETMGIGGQPWEKPIAAANASGFFGKFVDSGVGDVPNLGAIGTDLTSGATATSSTIIRQVSGALNDYKVNGAKLKTAAVKTNTPVTVEVDSTAFNQADNTGVIMMTLTTSDAKKFDPSKFKEMDVTVKVTDESGKEVTSSIYKASANKGAKSVILRVSLKDIVMGSYTLELTVGNVINQQKFEIPFVLPEYVDIKDWLGLSGYDAIQEVNSDAGEDGVPGVTIFKITDGDSTYHVGYGVVAVSGDFGSATVRTYVKIDEAGLIKGMKVVNVDYENYNRVDGDSLNDTDINGELVVDDLDTGASAFYTHQGAQLTVNRIATVYSQYKTEAGN